MSAETESCTTPQQSDVGSRRVLVFSPLFEPAYLGGGPIRSLAALMNATPSRYRTLVLASDRDLGQKRRLPVVNNSRIGTPPRERYYVSQDSWRELSRALVDARSFQPDLIYANSLFSFKLSIIPVLLWRIGWFGEARLVLAPRGELGTGALALKSTKKRFFLRTLSRVYRSRRLSWHASSHQEEHQVRRVFGSHASVYVRENETSLPPEPVAPVLCPNRTLKVVSIGRVTAIKRLDLVLRALQEVTEPVDLTIAGPEEDVGYAARCRSIIAGLPSHVRVRMLGPVPPAEVRELIRQHDVLVMPTAGENFGHVIAEALSVSCPVICSDRTPWTSVLHNGGGSVLDSDDTRDWAAEIDAYARGDSRERLERKQRAGSAYTRWASRQTGQHIFEIAAHG